MNCPLRNFEECPEHNKKNGCAFWMSYAGNKNTVETKFEGCAIVLTPMLLMENANCLGLVAGEVHNVGAEVSAGRCENIKTGEAARMQLLAIAHGNAKMIMPEYTTPAIGEKNVR